jgi:hypothetical protein
VSAFLLPLSDMATCRPTLFLLTVKEILLVHFIITNFRVAHKMLCTPWLRNPLTTSRLSCLGRKAALTTIFLSVRQSRISQPCYTNNCFCIRSFICCSSNSFDNFLFLTRRNGPNMQQLCPMTTKRNYSGFNATRVS